MVMHNCIDEFWRIEIIAFYQSLLRKLMRFYFIPYLLGSKTPQNAAKAELGGDE